MPVPKNSNPITNAIRMMETSQPNFSLNQPDTPKII